MLKYFVSTNRTQGERDNDSNSIPKPEIVDLCSLSHEDPDNPVLRLRTQLRRHHQHLDLT